MLLYSHEDYEMIISEKKLKIKLFSMLFCVRTWRDALTRAYIFHRKFWAHHMWSTQKEWKFSGGLLQAQVDHGLMFLHSMDMHTTCIGIFKTLLAGCVPLQLEWDCTWNQACCKIWDKRRSLTVNLYSLKFVWFQKDKYFIIQCFLIYRLHIFVNKEKIADV